MSAQSIPTNEASSCGAKVVRGSGDWPWSDSLQCECGAEELTIDDARTWAKLCISVIAPGQS